MSVDGRNDALLLEVLTCEGDRLAAMPPDMLDAPVPTVEGFTVERVVRHVGRVHRWASRLLTAPADADPDALAAAAPALPKGPDCLVAYREALDELLGVLGDVDPQREVASFVGPAQARFWLRRQAHEVTVHRVDAADAVHAAGGPEPEPLDPVAAADGVGEWLDVFARVRHATKTGGFEPELLGHRFGFVATDIDPSIVNHWVLELNDARSAGSAGSSDDPASGLFGSEHDRERRAPTAEELVHEADVVLAAPAATLLLALWRRRPLESVTISGDATLAEALYDRMRF